MILSSLAGIPPAASSEETEMSTYLLTIFAADLTTVDRQTEHPTYAKAYRSYAAYERRHGRHAGSIDRLPMPGANDAESWDAYRLRQGVAAR